MVQKHKEFVSLSGAGPGLHTLPPFESVYTLCGSSLLCMRDPAPSSPGPEPGHRHRVHHVGMPLGEGLQRAGIIPVGIPPQHTHRGHSSESVAPPGREQAFFTFSANTLHTRTIQPEFFSKGLC